MSPQHRDHWPHGGAAAGAPAVLAAGPDDLDAIEVLHRSCSPATVRARYLGVPPRGAVRTLARTCEAFLLRAGPELVAVGHLAVRPGPDHPSAEVAVLVRDDHHRHGHGSTLIAAMAQAARERGAVAVHSLTRPGDPAALPVMRRALGRVRVHLEDGLATLVADLGPDRGRDLGPDLVARQPGY